MGNPNDFSDATVDEEHAVSLMQRIHDLEAATGLPGEVGGRNGITYDSKNDRIVATFQGSFGGGDRIHGAGVFSVVDARWQGWLHRPLGLPVEDQHLNVTFPILSWDLASDDSGNWYAVDDGQGGSGLKKFDEEGVLLAEPGLTGNLGAGVDWFDGFVYHIAQASTTRMQVRRFVDDFSGEKKAKVRRSRGIAVGTDGDFHTVQFSDTRGVKALRDMDVGHAIILVSSASLGNRRFNVSEMLDAPSNPEIEPDLIYGGPASGTVETPMYHEITGDKIGNIDWSVLDFAALVHRFARYTSTQFFALGIFRENPGDDLSWLARCNIDGTIEEVYDTAAADANALFTEWFAYPTLTTSVSIGTDPINTALSDNDSLVVGQLITDMRTALVPLALRFFNSVSGNKFNWIDSDADNIYFVSLGDRTKYGATGGAAYTWTRTQAEMEDPTDTYEAQLFDIDIGEIEEIVTKLEASSVA